MAIFRKVHTSFWSDTFIQDLTIEQRYFYLYLLTNEQTKQCGVYEISKKQISFDTGYSIDRVSMLLKYFISKGKIRYNEETKELAMGKWLKYNNSTSPKIKSCIDKEFEQVKDRVLIEYVCSMDTASQEEQEQEQEQEEEKKKIDFSLFWDLYPTKIGKAKCLDKWNKLTFEVQTLILEHLQWYKDWKEFAGWQHPHPETYLNQKRWEDGKPEERPVLFPKRKGFVS